MSSLCQDIWQIDTDLIEVESKCYQLTFLPGDGWDVKGKPRGAKTTGLFEN